MSKKRIPPTHPGEILLEDFMKPMGISQSRLARDLRVDPRRINEIVNGRRSITIDTSRRLAKYFGTSEDMWVNLQKKYELRLSQQDEELNQEIELIPPAKNRLAVGDGAK